MSRSPVWLSVFASRKMAAILALGFSSGLPLFLTSRTLQGWMTAEGVDLTTIGLFSLVGLPYSLKFLWAPFLDRFSIPFLGRRRGWMAVTQCALLAGLLLLAGSGPGGAPLAFAAAALFVAATSASQDIVVDAYRTDVLAHHEMGAGAAIYVLGYRVALLLAGALPFLLADRFSWPGAYALMAALMLVGVAASAWAPEPIGAGEAPKSVSEAVIEPFHEFFSRSGRRGAAILGFIVLYKLGDSLAANMATPFLLKAGFSQTQVGAVQGGLGLGATIVGVLAGGSALARLGINRSLWVFGGLQALSNLAYYLLALAPGPGGMACAVAVENFCAGLGTAAFVAFFMSLCSQRYSATQYALLTSLMAFSRDILVAPAGAAAQRMGWPGFFLFTLAAALPGLALLPVFAPWRGAAPLGAAPRAES